MESDNETNGLFDEKVNDINAEIDQQEISDRKIHFTTPDRKIKDLYDDWKNGDLDPRPAFQRGYVWDNKKASRLVESVLMRVPIPVVYTAELDDSREIVIDGQQRLLSLFGFIDGKFPKNNEVFKISGLEVLTELNGSMYKDWEKNIQRAFCNYTLPMITISKESNSNIRFEIFERLNTGSVKLNDQELRNCIYRGSYNDFCCHLAKNEDFKFILNSPALSERMLDVELVLRFLAFQHTNYLRYKSSMKKFLNNEMREHLNITEENKRKLEADFKKSVELIRTIFGNKAFKRLSIGNEKDHNSEWEVHKLNRGLFDILMLGFSLFEKNQIMPYIDSIREELLWLSTSNEKFIDALSGSGTDSKEKIQFKFDTWIASLRKIVGYPNTEPRCFSWDLKRRLWEAEPICAYEKCGQRILDVDDAEIDHVEFYWRGGKTIPSNARLVHRYCNKSRGGHLTQESTLSGTSMASDSLTNNKFESNKSVPKSVDDLISIINNQETKDIAYKLIDQVMAISKDVCLRIGKDHLNFFGPKKFCSIFPQKRGFCFEVKMDRNDVKSGLFNVTIHCSNKDMCYFHVNQTSKLNILVESARAAFLKINREHSSHNY